MNKHLHIQDRSIRYRLQRSARARTMRLTVHCDGTVALTVPRWVTERAGEHFLKQKASWLLEKLSFYEQFTDTHLARLGRRDYLRHKTEARAFVQNRLDYFARRYGYTYNRVSIRDQKRAWGSCSSKGNLNFNYKVLFLPAALRDYVIVHELCHLQELNHSPKFWALVAKEIPEYAQLRNQLKQIL